MLKLDWRDLCGTQSQLFFKTKWCHCKKIQSHLKIRIWLTLVNISSNIFHTGDILYFVTTSLNPKTHSWLHLWVSWLRQPLSLSLWWQIKHSDAPWEKHMGRHTHTNTLIDSSVNSHFLVQHPQMCDQSDICRFLCKLYCAGTVVQIFHKFNI